MRKENTSDRDKDLFDVFIKKMSESKYPICLTDVLKEVVKHPAKRFYVSSRRAHEIIVRIRNGEDVKLSPERERMFHCIMELVEEQEAKYNDKPLKHIIEDIIDQPAPEFYLKPSSAKIILHHERRRQKDMQQLRMESRRKRMEKRRLC